MSLSNQDLFDKRSEFTINKYSRDKDNWDPVDYALFSPKMIYETPLEKAKELRFKAIKYAFNRHYQHSGFYNKFCKELEVKPEDIKSESDYNKIPLISDIIFKSYPLEKQKFVNWLKNLYVGELPPISIKNYDDVFDEVINSLKNSGITLVFSSGTGGRFSFVPRDKITWNRQLYVCSRIFEFSPTTFLTEDYNIIWLGPNPKNTNLYIGKLTMMLFDLFDESKIKFGIQRELTTKLISILSGYDETLKGKIKTSLVKPFAAQQQSKTLEDIVKMLEKNELKDEEIVIGGPPFFLSFLMSKIEKKGLKFNLNKGMVITAGGWKTYSGFAVSDEEFRSKVEKVLGIPTSNCRDIYGMVECNSLNVTCEGHYKHIPSSVLYPMVLDEESEIVGYGEYGRFAFLDPLANSYPGFVMTGDRVKILEHCPVCNRPGPVIVSDISRMSGVQDRGCGATLAKMFSEEVSNNK